MRIMGWTLRRSRAKRRRRWSHGWSVRSYSTPIMLGARRTIVMYALWYRLWKSLLAYFMASMCSTMQSPRAEKAFSKACAARTCPAPEDADKSSTRGLVFMRAARLCKSPPGLVLSFPGGKFFENAARDALQLAEASQVVLEFGVHELGILGTKLDTQDHVAELDGMGKQRVLLEFFESGFGVVVIHKSPGRVCSFLRRPSASSHCTRARRSQAS